MKYRRVVPQKLIQADYRQQCPWCKFTIEKGTWVGPGAFNALSSDNIVFMHLPCAQACRTAGVTHILDDGWREATSPQHCFVQECRKLIPPGGKLYRLMIVPRGVTESVCPNCYRSKTAPKGSPDG